MHLFHSLPKSGKCENEPLLRPGPQCAVKLGETVHGRKTWIFYPLYSDKQYCPKSNIEKKLLHHKIQEYSIDSFFDEEREQNVTIIARNFLTEMEV